ncbi:hypothetical protein NLG97_g6632 [Lecanicillium saksenae]|uniref:Uncharacterized protein n=1 Tax=Lecanicillium saksenae TaxID=468837 RepID=A0ACC1QQS3_9HYPO|nr:hypothetical protein NLG97_g6632 [Lecanicillium saksenae]
MTGGSCGEGSQHSDTIVRWNTAKELPGRDVSHKPLPETPPMKRDVRFNPPEIKFTHDDGSLDWMPGGHQNAPEIGGPRKSTDPVLPPRVDSVATHILDSSLARANHVLRLRKQARQERRALKESGDYLGVQGVNPETGRLDVETPTDSDESQPSHAGLLGGNTGQKPIVGSFDQGMTEKQQKIMLLKAHEDELRRLEKSKQEAEELANQLMWRRHTKEWSIVKDPGTKKLPVKQLKSLAENSANTRIEDVKIRKEETLIDLDDSQIQDSSCESLDSTSLSQNDRESCGTVVRTPHHRSLADVSRAALELFENGISFDHSFRSKRASNGSPSRHESSEAISPTSKVERGAKHIRNSDSQPFLGKYRDCQEIRGAEQIIPSQRTVTRRTLRELTNSLRTKASLTNLLMTSPSVRLRTMARKNMMRREDTNLPMNQPIVGAWIEDLNQTEQVKREPPSLPLIEHQEPLRLMPEKKNANLWIKGYMETNMAAEKPTRADPPSSVSTPDEIRQEMKSLQELLKQDMEEIGKENSKTFKRNRSIGVDTEAMEKTTAGIDQTGESACTYITITTGSMRAKPGKLKDFNELGMSKQQIAIESCAEMKSSKSSKTEDMPAHTPNDTTCAVAANVQKGTGAYVLKPTRVANRIQLRQKKEVNEAQNTEGSPSTSNRSDIVTPPVQRGLLRVGYQEERKKKTARVAKSVAATINTPSAMVPTVKVALTLTRHKDCECSQCLWIPGGFPEHLGEDDAIAPHSVKSVVSHEKQLEGLRTAFDCTLGQFVAAIELYCRIVWPVFDPYSSLWERNAEKKTTLLDVIVLVLAVPGAIVAIALAAWALRALCAVGSIAYSAIMGLGRNALLL